MLFLATLTILASLGRVYAGSDAGPIVTLFLPMAKGSNVAASIVTEAPNATVYAIGCLQSKSACAGDCTFDQSVTVTEGPSTLRYTWTDVDRAFSVANHTGLVHPITTVACNLFGAATSSGGTSIRATQAICTASSSVYPVAGRGKSSSSNNGTQTTTLKSSQIEYVAVTVTGEPSMTSSGSKTAANATTTVAGGNATASASASAFNNGAGAVAGTRLPVAGYAVALGGVVMLGSLGFFL